MKIGILSPWSGAGTSLLTASLAATFAHLGLRCTAVDLDWSANTTRWLDLPWAPPLPSYAFQELRPVGDMRPRMLLRGSSFEGCWIFPAQSPRSMEERQLGMNPPAEVLEELLRDASATRDITLVDLPSMFPPTARTVVSLIDVLLVVVPLDARGAKDQNRLLPELTRVALAGGRAGPVLRFVPLAAHGAANQGIIRSVHARIPGRVLPIPGLAPHKLRWPHVSLGEFAKLALWAREPLFEFAPRAQVSDTMRWLVRSMLSDGVLPCDRLSLEHPALAYRFANHQSGRPSPAKRERGTRAAEQSHLAGE